MEHKLVVFDLGREEINKSKFNTMIGLVDRERVDEELYDDFESAKAREVRFACTSSVGKLRKPLLCYDLIPLHQPAVQIVVLYCT